MQSHRLPVSVRSPCVHLCCVHLCLPVCRLHVWLNVCLCACPCPSRCPSSVSVCLRACRCLCLSVSVRACVFRSACLPVCAETLNVEGCLCMDVGTRRGKYACADACVRIISVHNTRVTYADRISSRCTPLCAHAVHTRAHIIYGERVTHGDPVSTPHPMHRDA